MLAEVALEAQRSKVVLERARTEVAATRALADAARIMADNPGLLQLRMVQSGHLRRDSRDQHRDHATADAVEPLGGALWMNDYFDWGLEEATLGVLAFTAARGLGPAEPEF